MEAVQIIMESIGLIVGSLAAGVLMCWVPWSACKLIRHPEWGPLLVVVPIFLAVTGRLPNSEFFTLTLIIAGLAVVPFCVEGRAWRSRMLERDRGVAEQVAHGAIDFLPATPASYRRYPAIAGCICEARQPNPEETKKVASRMLREAFADQSQQPSFAKRRAVLRAAKAALTGEA